MPPKRAELVFIASLAALLMLVGFAALVYVDEPVPAIAPVENAP
jgi:hypothetical protein